MDSLPNVDAVEFFLSEVFPLIRDRLPGAALMIADARRRTGAEAVQGLTGVTVSARWKMCGPIYGERRFLLCHPHRLGNPIEDL